MIESDHRVMGEDAAKAKVMELVCVPNDQKVQRTYR